ncbi:unnamed protein product [Notodromas monacha]|uniref:Uncharacterized protein n=1 Tax=Notodromas monacha TaxID=399045 RepID=A0A7R9GFB6_9CRUS|nr:unnamed protein product [Notodromas monacha]CAG0918655.1 unnamed protein product [Notodromas monacha]
MLQQALRFNACAKSEVGKFLPPGKESDRVRLIGEEPTFQRRCLEFSDQNPPVEGDDDRGEESVSGEDRLVGGWSQSVTIPCVGYVGPTHASYTSSCKPREIEGQELLRGEFNLADTWSPPAWPNILTRAFRVFDAKDLIENVFTGNIAPELWDTHFANEEMLRYEAPLVKESFDSYYEKIRGLSTNVLTNFLKRFDTYVEIYGSLRELHGYKYLQAERDLLDKQNVSITRRYAEVSKLMDDPLVDAVVGSQFFALEGQAYQYIALLEEQMELGELAFYLNIANEDFVSDPATAALRQIKWAGKLVKNMRRVAVQLAGIESWLTTFVNFMDDLRETVDPLLIRWGCFGNVTPKSQPYSTGVCAAIEAAMYFMGQVPGPIRSNFLVYLRAGGVDKARYPRDFRYSLSRSSMKFGGQMKAIQDAIREPGLEEFTNLSGCRSEFQRRLDSISKFAKAFFAVPHAGSEAIEGFGLEQELRSRGDAMQNRAESKLPS